MLLALAGWPLGRSRAASNLPPGFQDTTIVTGLDNPTAMQFAPDGRLFVAEQGGRLRVIKGGVLLPTPFLRLDVNADGERGLLGVAFDPAFATTQFVYVFYTASTPTLHNRISRFKASGDVVDPTIGEVVLLDFDDLGSSQNHNGGALHFGIDGKLYAAHGDNGESSNAQAMTNLLGKIIRMNPITDPVAQVPVDNPFAASASGKQRLIWALGLRNPFTFSIHSGNSTTYVNDVGENMWEEVNHAHAGANLGWPTTEGHFDAASHPALTSPRFAYRHANDSPSGCAITGGAFYDPSVPTFPASYIGRYFFADFCAGWIYSLDPESTAAPVRFADDVLYPVDLKVGPDGALYYLARLAGSVGMITANAAGGPQITLHPSPQAVGLSASATFSVSAIGAQPLTYQWTKNDVAIAGATSASYSTPPATRADHDSTYRCFVTNSAGTVASQAAVLGVLDNTLPSVTIAAPTAQSRYSGGTVLAFSGSALDAEDGALAPTRLSWRIDFHHDTHVHPAMPETPGVAGGTFAIPNMGETSANVWYRVHLKATDSAGTASTTFVDVLPLTTTITVATNPSGLTALVDGQPVTTPRTIAGVVGMVRTLGVVAPQAVGGVSYHFVGWSDGGTAAHAVTTPASPTTYIATYASPPSAPRGLRVVGGLTSAPGAVAHPR